jgi:SOUL heme-binding protein
MVAMSFFSSITLSACSIVGIRSGTEEPRYTVLQSQGPLKSASMVHGSQPKTEVTGNECSSRSDGFRRVARYIFGANSSKAASR